MSYYVPGSEEKDPAKVIMSLQQAHSNTAANTTSITANTASIATNTAAITNLQTAGQGLVNSGGSLAVSLTRLTASLGADVLLNNIANYFTGPTVAQGTAGTWLVTGTVTVVDVGTAGFFVRITDGTTVIASARADAAANFYTAIAVSGIITSPAGNLKIEVRDASLTTGKMIFNATGNSKDCTITAVRIA